MGDTVAMPSLKTDGTHANVGATELGGRPAADPGADGAGVIDLPSLPDPGGDVIAQASTPDPQAEP